MRIYGAPTSAVLLAIFYRPCLRPNSVMAGARGAAALTVPAPILITRNQRFRVSSIAQELRLIFQEEGSC